MIVFDLSRLDVFRLNINNVYLEHNKSITSLGRVIAVPLTVKEHIEYISDKARKTTRVVNFFTHSTLEKLSSYLEGISD